MASVEGQIDARPACNLSQLGKRLVQSSLWPGEQALYPCLEPLAPSFEIHGMESKDKHAVLMSLLDALTQLKNDNDGAFGQPTSGPSASIISSSKSALLKLSCRSTGGSAER